MLYYVLEFRNIPTVKIKGGHMWPVSHAVSNRVLHSVPNVWQEDGENRAPVLACLTARHSSPSSQTVRHEWNLFSCLFHLLPELCDPTMKTTYFPPAHRWASVVPLHLPWDDNHGANGAECSSFCFYMLLLSNPSVPLFSASQDKRTG